MVENNCDLVYEKDWLLLTNLIQVFEIGGIISETYFHFIYEMNGIFIKIFSKLQLTYMFKLTSILSTRWTAYSLASEMYSLTSLNGSSVWGRGAGALWDFTGTSWGTTSVFFLGGATSVNVFNREDDLDSRRTDCWPPYIHTNINSQVNINIQYNFHVNCKRTNQSSCIYYIHTN